MFGLALLVVTSGCNDDSVSTKLSESDLQEKCVRTISAYEAYDYSQSHTDGVAEYLSMCYDYIEKTAGQYDDMEVLFDDMTRSVSSEYLQNNGVNESELPNEVKLSYYGYKNTYGDGEYYRDYFKEIVDSNPKGISDKNIVEIEKIYYGMDTIGHQELSCISTNMYKNSMEGANNEYEMAFCSTYYSSIHTPYESHWNNLRNVIGNVYGDKGTAQLDGIFRGAFSWFTIGAADGVGALIDSAVAVAWSVVEMVGQIVFN